MTFSYQATFYGRSSMIMNIEADSDEEAFEKALEHDGDIVWAGHDGNWEFDSVESIDE